MHKLSPIFIENSKLPVWLSHIAPIDVWAFNFAFLVFCRGKLTPTLKQHETIHFHQQLELFFIFQWILYGVFSIIGRFKFGTWKEAYYRNPFEQEAYDNENVTNYLKKRKCWAWRNYLSF